MVVSLSIGIVKRVLSKYTGYVEARRKEDDLAVKKHILSEVEKSKNYLKNILEAAYGNKDTDGTKAVKKALDELDIFSNEIDLSEEGHRYGFFATHKGTSLHQISKLVDHDKAVIESMANVTEASKTIEDLMLEKENMDLQREMGKIRQYVTTARNEYRDRIEHIKKI